MKLEKQSPFLSLNNNSPAEHEKAQALGIFGVNDKTKSQENTPADQKLLNPSGNFTAANNQNTSSDYSKTVNNPIKQLGNKMTLNKAAKNISEEPLGNYGRGYGTSVDNPAINALNRTQPLISKSTKESLLRPELKDKISISEPNKKEIWAANVLANERANNEDYRMFSDPTEVRKRDVEYEDENAKQDYDRQQALYLADLFDLTPQEAEQLYQSLPNVNQQARHNIGGTFKDYIDNEENKKVLK